jgi:raffinose/stachyose/melibiose transport system permease protein
MVSGRPYRGTIIAFLAAPVLIYTVFLVLPIADSLRLSLYAQSPGQPAQFVGLGNYDTLFNDPNWAPRFWGALRNNFVFFCVHMVAQNPIGLLLAALLSARRLALRGVYRTLIFMPTMLSVVIVGFIWELLLSPLWGVGHRLLGYVDLGSLFRPWLGLEGSALITLALISVWQFVGIPMMLFTAALLSIPDDVTEAAVIDGASPGQIFWRVKFPLILPTVGIVSVLTYVGNFNAFDLIYAVKGALAGPNFSTDLLGTYFYRTFFGYQLQLGNASMGATVATVMFLIILAGVCLYLFGVQRNIARYEL